MENLNKKIQTLGTKKSYGKEEFLFFPQEKAPGFYYLLSGEIRVFRMDAKGKEIEIARLRPGDFIGEAVAIASESYPAFAQAVKPAEVLYFESQKVWREIEINPAVAKFFLVLLARKCLLLNERIEALNLSTVRQRLIRFLLLGCSGDRGCLIDLKIKKADLARELGTISETLSRILKGLKNEGVIEVEGKKIRILDCARLRKELSV